MKRIAVLLLAVLPTLAPVPLLADVTERASTLADRQAVNLTIYNDGTALIHDRRRIYLDAGLNRIAWRDVSANMEPTTALLDSLSDSKISVLEQNFDYDVLGQTSLLRSYVGKEITVVHPAQFSGQRDRRERARILSVDDGVVLQYADRIETSINGYIEFPSVPKSLRDRPTLALDIDSERTGSQDLDLRYLSGGLNWSADYIGTLSADQTRLTLAGLVTVSNTSGTSYGDARLQLVAGNVHVAKQEALKTIAMVTSRSSADTYQTGMSQESLSEYHLYTLGRPTTILDKQTKQLALLTAHGIPVRKTLELRGSNFYYYNQNADLGDRLRIGMYVSFENRGVELGIPLPAGTVRIYQDDSHGLSQFVGSDSIDHTPRNDTVRLYLGDSFDLVARKKQTDFHFISTCRTSTSYDVTITNGKDVPQDVLVIEPIPAEWTILDENLAHEKSSSSTATWTVHVPKDGKATLTYTADVTWCK